jgi:ribosomal protein L11 methyltransferase
LQYPALDLNGIDAELALACVDEYSPTAAEERSGLLTIFFSNALGRERARAALLAAFPCALIVPRDVDDEDWARRSQEALGPVTVGRITIVPPSPDGTLSSPSAVLLPPGQLRLVVRPSMAFGTGHHATTRLCLAAMQSVELADRVALDVGTGSGVLALAARALGAKRALGVDNDPDAIRCANENLLLNGHLDRVEFEVADALVDLPQRIHAVAGASQMSGHGSAAVDVITANLTGTLLSRSAPLLLSCLVPEGTAIISGILESERSDVADAFRAADPVWEAHEDEWLALGFRRRV